MRQEQAWTCNYRNLPDKSLAWTTDKVLWSNWIKRPWYVSVFTCLHLTITSPSHTHIPKTLGPSNRVWNLMNWWTVCLLKEYLKSSTTKSPCYLRMLSEMDKLLSCLVWLTGGWRDKHITVWGTDAPLLSQLSNIALLNTDLPPVQIMKRSINMLVEWNTEYKYLNIINFPSLPACY